MTEKRRSRKPTDRPLKPSRALGSLKGDEGARAVVRGPLKLKPAAEYDRPVEGPRQRGDAKPVGRALQPRAVRGRTAKPAHTAGASRTRSAADQPTPQPDLPDQVALRPRRGTSDGPSGYVRFRVRVEDGRAAIVDSQLVESDLLMPSALHGEYAYEVTDGARLLHADSIPDLGVFRSFSHPNGTTEQLRHHIYRESAYEFDARVPAAALTRNLLPRIAIVLYRVKEPVQYRALMLAAPLGAQLEREVREVTRVDGIPPSTLPPTLRPQRRSRAT
jgi:hypothetical protein